MKQVTLFQAFDGFILDKQAAGMSPNTIRNYHNTVKKVALFFPEDQLLHELKREDWVRFMVWLQNEHITNPGGAAKRPPKKLSPKSAANIHTDLRSFYTWATSAGIELVKDHWFKTIDQPRYEVPMIETFTKAQVQTLLKACDTTKAWKTNESISNERPQKERDRAIILILLSTGVRASELCGIRHKDINMANHSIYVEGKGKGRDSKPRTVHFGKVAGKALWTYLRQKQQPRDNDPVFTVGPDDTPRPMTRDVLDRLLLRIGARAGIPDVYPHRFRHTFATEFLRNGSDILKLQALLGHSSLEMVQRYAHIVESDCAAAHEEADPADRWRL